MLSTRNRYDPSRISLVVGRERRKDEGFGRVLENGDGDVAVFVRVYNVLDVEVVVTGSVGEGGMPNEDLLTRLRESGGVRPPGGYLGDWWGELDTDGGVFGSERTRVNESLFERFEQGREGFRWDEDRRVGFELSSFAPRCELPGSIQYSEGKKHQQVFTRRRSSRHQINDWRSILV
jgi:hypothetical protein